MVVGWLSTEINFQSLRVLLERILLQKDVLGLRIGYNWELLI